MALRAKFSKQSLLAILMLLSLVTTLLGPRTAEFLRGPVMFITSRLGGGGWYVTASVKAELNSLTADTISQREAQRLKLENIGRAHV